MKPIDMNKIQSRLKFMLLAGVFAGSIFVSRMAAQTQAPSQSVPASEPAKVQPAPPPAPKPSASPSRYHPDRFAGRAGTYYQMVWGVDSLILKWAESGEVIRFSYRVLDPAKAKALNDKKAEPALIDPKAGVKLVVPSLEKVGQLRQTGTPEAGKSYWMAFSNKGRLVKKGDHVDVVIGKFRAQGLVVD
jgi:hypothetical protein